MTVGNQCAGIISSGPSGISIAGLQKTVLLISCSITLFGYPLIMLLLPAIFMDREDGVTACFKSALRAGTRNYFPMLTATFVLMLPLLLMSIFSSDIYGIAKSPLFHVFFPYQMITIPVIITYLFVKYDQIRQEKSGLRARTEPDGE